jgi:O-antigen ligase
MMVGATAVTFSDEIQDAFRLNEITEYYDSDETGSSMHYRTLNIWPGIVKSLETARIAFGWGHAGLAFIPHKFFVDQSQMSDVPGEEVGSAESQYMDVLLRQGLVGLSLFLLILAFGLRYSYKLYKAEKDSNRRYLWKASIAWQVAIIAHGITVETVRLSLYSLFFSSFWGFFQIATVG